MDLTNNSKKTKPSIVKVTTVVQTNPDGTQKVSSGSGFIVNDEGIVISNSHVVKNDNPQNTVVHLTNGDTKQCTKIIHRDNEHDFVILQIEKGDFQSLELGEYNDVQEGSEIYFCGFPLRSNNYIIHGGSISSKFNLENINIFQLDASVNSRNSGGPLLNLEDKVVGIVTRKAGGIDEKFLNLGRLLSNAPPTMTVSYTLTNGQEINFDPIKAIGELVGIIHDYTSVGIGYSYSIEYAKIKLREFGLIS